MSTSEDSSGQRRGQPADSDREVTAPYGSPEEDDHVAGEPDSSYTDNPSFAAYSGEATDSDDSRIDYVEEPGVGGVSTDKPPESVQGM